MRDRLAEIIRNARINASPLSQVGYAEADALIENGAILPPCKVGDKIYYIGDGDVQELNIEFVTITQNGFEVGVEIADSTIVIYEFWIGNKNYYYTKEEAEKALRGEGE